MNPNSLFRRAAVFALGAGLAFASLGHGQTVDAEQTDLNHITYNNNNGTASYSGTANATLGGNGTGGNMVRGPVIGFALPVLTGSLEEMTFRYTITGQTNNPQFNGHIYIFNPEVTPSAADALDAWWAGEAADDRGLVRTVSLDAINPGLTYPAVVSVTLGSDMLEGFYDENGSPTSAEGKIWFRLSPGKTAVLGANYQVHRYNTDPASARLSVAQLQKVDDLLAPIALDFGLAKDTEENLLRNRPEDFVLQTDSLRFEPTSELPTSSSALARLGNYQEQQNFVVESDISLISIAAAGSSHAGLMALDYGFVLNPGEPATGAGILQIRDELSGNVLAEAPWEGESLGTFFDEQFADDFSDYSASAAAWSNPFLWEVGLQGDRDVFSTDLSGPATGRTRDAALRSPPIDLTGLTEAVLSYSDFQELDNAPEHHWARVSVLRASNSEVLEVLSETTGESGGWRSRAFSLSAASLNAGQVVIEFLVKTDDWPKDRPLAGWSIADVAVSSSAGLPANYNLKAEGTFASSGLTLDFTVSEDGEAGVVQTLSTLVEIPAVGNLFGIGGINQVGGPVFDFANLNISLGEAVQITNIPPQTVFRNTSTEALPFKVYDENVDPSLLTVTASSSDAVLVPTENIVIQGEGSDRTVTVTPAAGGLGSANVTLTLSGGATNATSVFEVNVVMPDPPTITTIADQTIPINSNTGPVAFSIGHQVVAVEDLVVTGSSSNTDLVPDGNIVFAGSGADRTVTVTPTEEWVGQTTITVTVTAEDQETSLTFGLTVEQEVWWETPTVLTDLHHLQYNFGTNFPTPTLQFNLTAIGNIGSMGNAASRNSRSPVHGFALPVLDNFSGVESATYTLTLTGKTNNPAWNAQLYLYSPEIIPSAVPPEDLADIFWASSAEDTRAFVRTVSLDLITPETPNGTVSVTIPGALLEGFYDANGAPISADGKIWFRVSEGAESSGVIRYETQASIDHAQAPSFTLNQYPFDEAFEGGVGAYTATVIEGSTRSHVSAWETVGGSLRMNTTSWDEGVQTHALTRTDVPLLVGYEWQAAFSAEFTGPRDLGLYVGAGHPNEDEKTDYINVFVANDGSVQADGFDGATPYGSVNGGLNSVNSLFIARTATNTFQVGWYDGETRNVLATRTVGNPLVGKSVGFYAAVEGAGIVGSFTSATITRAPEMTPAGFGDWADANITEGFDRTFGGSAAGDGVANGIKFAMGLDPMQRVQPGDLPVVGRDADGRLTLTYQIDLDAGDVIVGPEVALALDQVEWFRETTGGDAPYVTVDEGTLIEGSIYQFTATAMNVEEDTAAFMRVFVELNQ